MRDVRRTVAAARRAPRRPLSSATTCTDAGSTPRARGVAHDDSRSALRELLRESRRRRVHRQRHVRRARLENAEQRHDRVRRPVEQQSNGRVSRRRRAPADGARAGSTAHPARRRSAAACPPRCRPPSHSAEGRRRPADRAHATACAANSSTSVVGDPSSASVAFHEASDLALRRRASGRSPRRARARSRPRPRARRADDRGTARRSPPRTGRCDTPA